MEMGVFIYSCFMANDSLRESDVALLARVHWMYSGGLQKASGGAILGR